MRVVCVIVNAYECVCAVPKETDRHTSMKSTKPPLIPPVIYGSQIHVMLRLNKRSFVTDSSLWSGRIGFAVLLLHRICPSLLLPPQGFLLTHTHTHTHTHTDTHTHTHTYSLTVLKVFHSHLSTHTFFKHNSVISLLWTCDPGYHPPLLLLPHAQSLRRMSLQQAPPGDWQSLGNYWTAGGERRRWSSGVKQQHAEESSTSVKSHKLTWPPHQLSGPLPDQLTYTHTPTQPCT